MSNPNIRPNEEATLAVVAAIDPDAYAAGTYDSGWVSLATFDSIQALVLAGDLGTNATLDALLQQATDGSGTGAKAISGKAITQLTQAGTDSNKQAIILCRSDELDVAGGFTHVRLRLTVAVATSDAGGLILGHNARYAPATDATTVDEIVA